MDMKNATLSGRQTHYRNSPSAQTPVLTHHTRESGDRLAGHLNGDSVSFAKILASENEKHRRIQELRQIGKKELKQIQPQL